MNVRPDYPGGVVSKAQEKLEAARADLRRAEESLLSHRTFLEDTEALLEDPDMPKDAREILETTALDAFALVSNQVARCKELRDVTIPALEAEQPEYPQYQLAWFSFYELRQAHFDLIGVGEAPPDEVDIGGEADERALAERLGFSFMADYVDWAKTVRYSRGELDLSTWPHTLPDPPVEPFNAEERLKALLNDPDGEARAFGRVALGALANARAVRDYKGQRTLS